MIFQLVDKCVDFLFDNVVNVKKIEVLKNPNEIEENIFNAINPNENSQSIQNDRKNDEVKSNLVRLKSNKYSDPIRKELQSGPKKNQIIFNSINESSVIEINEIVSILSEDKSETSYSNSKNIQNDNSMKSSETPKFLPKITPFNKKYDNPLSRKIETGLFRHKNSTRNSLLNRISNDEVSNLSKKEINEEKNDISSLKKIHLKETKALSTENSEKNEKINNSFLIQSPLISPEPHDESYDDFSQGNISGLDKLIQEVRRGKLNQSVNKNKNKDRKSTQITGKSNETYSNRSSSKIKSNISYSPIMKKITFKKKSSLISKNTLNNEDSNNN